MTLIPHQASGRHGAQSATASARAARLSGFTLIELMVTIAIMAVLLTLAAPSFRTLLLNNRLNSQVNALFGGLNYARSTALSANTVITVCPVGASNSPICGGNWQAGWMVVDPSGAGTILLSSAAPANGPVLTSLPPQGGGAAATTITFDTRGLTVNVANFSVCDSRGAAYAGSLMVSPTGFVQADSSSSPRTAVWNAALPVPC
jgi:type IV fimbrial biogenesis protein FimT